MLGLAQKLIHFQDVQKTERMPEDDRILILRSERDLPFYRHAFYKVSGAVYPVSLLTSAEVAETTAFAQRYIAPEDLAVGMLPLKKQLVSSKDGERGFVVEVTMPLRGEIPEPLTRACTNLARIFRSATGRKAKDIAFVVNNTFPTYFHEHDNDVMTYTVQGRGTICMGANEFDMPKNHAVFMKPGLLHKTAGEQSFQCPRLTFLLG